MDRGLALILTLIVGGMIALQAPMNSVLGKATGTVTAAFISFASGVVVLFVIVAVSGNMGQLKGMADVSWYYLLGGLLGVVYVTVALVTVRSLGVGGVTAATVAGSLIAAVAVDWLGVLGVDRIAVSWERVLGVALLLAGTLLVVRN